MVRHLRHALIVAYAFPPNAAVGSMRPLRWCKWLPRVSDWSCSVATVARPPLRRDDSLLAQVPDDVAVLRTPIREPWHAFFPPGVRRHGASRIAMGGLRYLLHPMTVPDPQRFWHRDLIPAVARFHHERPIDVVIATAPPWSALLSGSRLARELGVPLVLDFRDPWTEFIRRKQPWWQIRWERYLERTVCSGARAVLSTSETYTENLRSRCPRVDPSRFLTVHNGYDEEAFDAAPSLSVDPSRLTILHLGSLYSRRKPFASFQGIARWLERRPDARASFKLCFVGTIEVDTRRALEAAGILDVCEVTGHVSHGEAIARCRSADILLLAMGDSSLTPMGWIPSKVFEYLAAERPILAHTVPGEAAALICEADANLLVGSSNPDDYASVLERYWRAKMDEGGFPFRPNPEVIARYKQECLARRLADVLDLCARGIR